MKSSFRHPIVYAKSKFAWVPVDIWAIGISTLLITASAGMLFSVSPLFITTALGLSTAFVGIVEGIVEPLSLGTKVVSGITSDYIKKRKPLIMLGYVLAAIGKVLFAIASGITLVFTARIIERISNGIQASPRDALISEITPPQIKGASFGLTTTLKTAGTFFGGAVVSVLLYLTQDNYQLVIWAGAVPAILAMFILHRYVKEPELDRDHIPPRKEKRVGPKPRIHELSPISVVQLRRIGLGYWTLIGVATVFMGARFSEAFLILRVKELGAPAYISTAMLSLLNLFSAFSSYPVGHLSDRMNRSFLLILSFICLIISNLFLIFAGQVWVGMIGVALWGVQRGVTQTLFNAMIAEETPNDLLGTAFGLFHLASGIALVFASFVAGWLAEDKVSYAFVFGVFISGLALILLLIRQGFHNRRAKSA